MTSMPINKAGAKGGYSKGEIVLRAGETLYLYAGQKGEQAVENIVNAAGGAGGWNGGGDGGIGWNGLSEPSGGGGGGGATSVSLGSGNCNDAPVLNARIIVAGGGGGATRQVNSTGSGGGGARGNGGESRAHNGSTEPGGTWSGNISSGFALGLGQNGRDADITSLVNYGSRGSGGGGGGYYGGYVTNITGAGSDACGGGGSSYIKTAAGTDNNLCIDTPYYFTNTGGSAGEREGHGLVRITYIGQ
jgi:hypothetical protein